MAIRKAESHSVEGKVVVGMLELPEGSWHVVDSIAAGNVFINSWKGQLQQQRLGWHEFYALDAVKMNLWQAYAPPATLLPCGT